VICTTQKVLQHFSPSRPPLNLNTYSHNQVFMAGSMHPLPEYRRSGKIGELYSETEIRATPERIWAVLTDFTEYPAWNPFIRSVRGNTIEGETITVDLRPSGATGMKIHPVILKVSPNRELRWVGRLFVRGLFDGEHVFAIKPLGDTRCLFVQHEYFSGLLLPLLETMLKKDTARGFAEMNEALKLRAETAR